MDMKPLTLNMVTAGLKLSKLQVRNILASQNKANCQPDDELDENTLMVLLTANLLETLEFLAPEQRTLILNNVVDAMQCAVANLALVQLAFCDRRYCLWTGNIGALDLTTGEKLTTLPAERIETISYNLNAVYVYGRLKIERRSGLHAKRQDDAGTVDEPADVRERAPNGVS